LSRDLNFITFLSDVHDSRKQVFINEIHKSMIDVTYPAMAPITSIEDKADRMFFIQSGSVNVSLEDGSILSTLHRGEAFGEASLLGCTEWVLGSHKVQYISTDFSLLSYVTVSDFLNIAKAFGGEILEQVETSREEFIKKSQERRMKAESFESGSDHSEGNTVVLIRWFELKKRMLDLDRKHTREEGESMSSEFLIHKLSASAAKMKNKNKLKSPEQSAIVHDGPVAPMTLRRRLSNFSKGATSDSAASKLTNSNDLVSLTKKVEEMNVLLKVRSRRPLGTHAI
jgi:CRP-like cAMP-binding protein